MRPDRFITDTHSRCSIIVTDADECITDCKGDTDCYEGCIGSKW